MSCERVFRPKRVVPRATTRPFQGRVFVLRKILCRTLEDAGVLGAPLVPWSTASLFIYGVLKVPATAYARYAILNWLVPIVASTYALTGMFMFRQKDHITKEEDK